MSLRLSYNNRVSVTLSRCSFANFAQCLTLWPAYSVVTRFVFSYGQVDRASRSAIVKMASAEEAARAMLTLLHKPLRLPVGDLEAGDNVRCMVMV